ncbi:hypothetical protein SAMN04487928_10383 [Butyrivibrio proteoclasticus]|uniref:DUF2194 domain-containing protein n=1 Tax=Butyrivibrio proteoclasticus TaxID=43305 RepID=A0A1I5R2Q7_9FIRM|nr:DUF2194 domain-containing protein [Butyrivibrio proteoclasticus]SFP52627.1 hypothetical protein SAMN04487928_10383 [Butyrivibrio proteoclasticus]
MKKKRFIALANVTIGFFAMFLLLLIERVGILYEGTDEQVTLLPTDNVVHMKELSSKKSCLLISDSGNDTSILITPQYEQIFADMRVSYDIIDLAKNSIEDNRKKDRLSDYKTVVIATNDYTVFGEDILTLTDWVKSGGRLLIGITPTRSEVFDIITSKLGIVEIGDNFVPVRDFVSDENYMLGAQKTYYVDDAYESALTVQLGSDTKVYAHTTDNVPLVWSQEYGKGKFVVCNFSYVSKAYRGIYSSAYTLLEDIFVYPVINASTFYLDDFPSPTPSGDGEYIRRDYGMGIAQFYSAVWWPKVLSLGEKHNIPYTGLIIETYEDDTGEILPSNESTADYYYYGNMLLNKGGEIGYHGYNHQPLCGPDYVYEDDIGYKVWESYDAMYNSLDELTKFSTGIFTNTELSVYVPPSDVLSPEGRALIGEEFPNIKAIASIYFEGPDAYSQEYEVSEDGIVETPRIVSSCIIDDYMKLASFSELNLHFVASHFMHPDDLLDEDRGAALGWEQLSRNLDEYMTWIDTSAPDIRHLTGSCMAGAVQRYVNVIPDTEISDLQLTITSDGLIDDAYYFIRVSEGKLVKVEGGKLIKLNETLYLLDANNETVTITRK